MSLLAPLKSLKIRLFSTFRIFKNCCQMTTNRLLIRKKALTVWKLQTIKVILYSNLFFMFSQDDTFALKLDKSLCPVIIRQLFKLNRCRGFSGTVVQYAVYIFYFIHNTAGGFSDDLPGNFGELVVVTARRATA